MHKALIFPEIKHEVWPAAKYATHGVVGRPIRIRVALDRVLDAHTNAWHLEL
jgi:hypothetical protein